MGKVKRCTIVTVFLKQFYISESVALIILNVESIFTKLNP